ncbi:hypothetical protein TRFO_04044 [Tritrichomonas foetus]|uniref:Uncharacterized protein n=1 Tax=Tritrichomonas foetus TaxID=1144522 RepID=A0A1J4KIA1_9EUKA|nr:hypothetical protein TRFO_04044 [Tritrichomonas foetus]|eukprot:OHT11097.1 hypothetical protein TRFO_04044 [Tritrichomonas foetus]
MSLRYGKFFVTREHKIPSLNEIGADFYDKRQSNNQHFNFNRSNYYQANFNTIYTNQDVPTNNKHDAEWNTTKYNENKQQKKSINNNVQKESHNDQKTTTKNSKQSNLKIDYDNFEPSENQQNANYDYQPPDSFFANKLAKQPNEEISQYLNHHHRKGENMNIPSDILTHRIDYQYTSPTKDTFDVYLMKHHKTKRDKRQSSDKTQHETDNTDLNASKEQIRRKPESISYSSNDDEYNFDKHNENDGTKTFQKSQMSNNLKFNHQFENQTPTSNYSSKSDRSNTTELVDFSNKTNSLSAKSTKNIESSKNSNDFNTPESSYLHNSKNIKYNHYQNQKQLPFEVSNDPSGNQFLNSRSRITSDKAESKKHDIDLLSQEETNSYISSIYQDSPKYQNISRHNIEHASSKVVPHNPKSSIGTSPFNKFTDSKHQSIKEIQKENLYSSNSENIDYLSTSQVIKPPPNDPLQHYTRKNHIKHTNNKIANHDKDSNAQRSQVDSESYQSSNEKVNQDDSYYFERLKISHSDPMNQHSSSHSSSSATNIEELNNANRMNSKPNENNKVNNHTKSPQSFERLSNQSQNKSNNSRSTIRTESPKDDKNKINDLYFVEEQAQPNSESEDKFYHDDVILNNDIVLSNGMTPSIDKSIPIDGNDENESYIAPSQIEINGEISPLQKKQQNDFSFVENYNIIDSQCFSYVEEEEDDELDKLLAANNSRSYEKDAEQQNLTDQAIITPKFTLNGDTSETHDKNVSIHNEPSDSNNHSRNILNESPHESSSTPVRKRIEKSWHSNEIEGTQTFEETLKKKSYKNENNSNNLQEFKSSSCSQKQLLLNNLSSDSLNSSEVRLLMQDYDDDGSNNNLSIKSLKDSELLTAHLPILDIEEETENEIFNFNDDIHAEKEESITPRKTRILRIYDSSSEEDFTSFHQQDQTIPNSSVIIQLGEEEDEGEFLLKSVDDFESSSDDEQTNKENQNVNKENNEEYLNKLENHEQLKKIYESIKFEHPRILFNINDFIRIGDDLLYNELANILE